MTGTRARRPVLSLSDSTFESVGALPTEHLGDFPVLTQNLTGTRAVTTDIDTCTTSKTMLKRTRHAGRNSTTVAFVYKGGPADRIPNPALFSTGCSRKDTGRRLDRMVDIDRDAAGRLLAYHLAPATGPVPRFERHRAAIQRQATGGGVDF